MVQPGPSLLGKTTRRWTDQNCQVSMKPAVFCWQSPTLKSTARIPSVLAYTNSKYLLIVSWTSFISLCLNVLFRYPPVNSGVGLGCPDFTILNWRCTGSGKWGSLQNHNTYPFHHYKIMTPTPTRSLESCKSRAPKILLGSHFSKKWPLQNYSPDPAHRMHFC